MYTFWGSPNGWLPLFGSAPVAPPRGPSVAPGKDKGKRNSGGKGGGNKNNFGSPYQGAVPAPGYAKLSPNDNAYYVERYVPP